MKTAIFIFFITVFSFTMCAQINKGVKVNMKVTDGIKIDTVVSKKNALAAKTSNKERKQKNILKKILSDYEGIDIRNAWGTLNKN